ncbi:unnamed protein product [Paramecium pentaurelia]|uniref:G domain-containing protein n=1 Tax=Paramecium pentaurelia TaxID=43138 RepID=A0A8S1V412_9CILI|nr:unnamed protein product [Paramecium pentaurelia]
MSMVLLGQIGSGKTTIYNKITNSKEATPAGGASVTRSVFMKKSCYGQGFSVLDTPGFGSDSNKIDHIAGVLSALSEGPINRIVILARFARTNVILEDVKRILPAFINYRHMITVIVTCWDFCKKKEEQESNKREIQQRLAQYKINSVMFVGKNDSSESICLQIDQIIATSPAQNVSLIENDIFQNFEMTDYDDGEIFEIEIFKGKLVTQYHNFFNQALILIEKHNIQKGLQADYFYAITQFAKQKVDDVMKQFEMEKLGTIDKLSENEQLKVIQIHFQLKNTIFKDYEYLVDAAHKQTHNSHFTKFIKKCHHCGEIWFKAAGCEGETVCGRLNGSHIDDFIKQEDPPLKFKVTYINEKLQVKLDESVKPKEIVLNEKNIKNLMTDETKIKLEQMTLNGETFKVGGAGCKRVIEWEKMFPLSEEEINTVLGILDIKLCEKMVEIEKLTQQKTLNQQIQYKEELDKKIKEQQTKIQRAT